MRSDCGQDLGLSSGLRVKKMKNVDLESLPIGEDAPEVVNAVEVPVGSCNRYEYEPELETIVRDRVLLGNIRYPVDYSFVPSTESDGGEPLNAMVAGSDCRLA